MQKKYSFSEITYITGEWSYEKTYAKKYLCQVFDEDGRYVKVIIRETRDKVLNEIKKMKGDK